MGPGCRPASGRSWPPSWYIDHRCSKRPFWCPEGIGSGNQECGRTQGRTPGGNAGRFGGRVPVWESWYGFCGYGGCFAGIIGALLACGLSPAHAARAGVLAACSQGIARFGIGASIVYVREI